MPDKEAIARSIPATPTLRIREISGFFPNATIVAEFGFAPAWVLSSFNPLANEDLPPYLHCGDRLYRMKVFLGDARSHLPSKRLKLADGTLPPQENDG
ncbi:hypothetical protein [Coleofasciculus sp. FACHB-1120]|uniref:hypothetical protein n=1 Tax=Coleofasciculus sp. FACHB-1120 TaxID=2692783 RepID=UPI003221FB31